MSNIRSFNPKFLKTFRLGEHDESFEESLWDTIPEDVQQILKDKNFVTFSTGTGPACMVVDFYEIEGPLSLEETMSWFEHVRRWMVSGFAQTESGDKLWCDRHRFSSLKLRDGRIMEAPPIVRNPDLRTSQTKPDARPGFWQRLLGRD